MVCELLKYYIGIFENIDTYDFSFTKCIFIVRNLCAREMHKSRINILKRFSFR